MKSLKGILIVFSIMTILLISSCGIPQEDYDKIIGERDTIQSEHDALQTQVASKTSEIEKLENDLNKSENSLSEARTVIDDINSSLIEANTELSRVKAELSMTTTNLNAAQFALAIPDVPILISPPSLVVYTHAPRTTTLKWEESNGTKPIRYHVEVEYTWHNTSSFTQWNEEHDYAWVEETQDTELTFNFVGGQPGRWRVRAVNDYGESEWSEWRYFRYTQ